MTVQLALYKGKGLPFNKLVRWWTSSEYSHCELVIDQLAYSSSLMDGGVRKKWIDFRPEHWDFIDLPWADADAVMDYFVRTDAEKYGVLGLIKSQLLNRNYFIKGSQFCSEWCANALGLPSPSSYSPRTLGELADFITKRYHP